MRRPIKALIAMAGVGVTLMVLGFFVFAGVATQRLGSQEANADGIVVLTGAEFRIAEGARLLEQKRGRRMLITGVHPRVTRVDLLRITHLPAATLDCCVDVDTHALDTIGNAREARTWIETHAFKSIILVTSNFHMPRSLAEFALALPDTEISAHPVVPRDFPSEAWWLNIAAARTLLAEYLKFLPAALRLATARVIGPWQSSAAVVNGDGALRRALA